jgi:hypothetical protein
LAEEVAAVYAVLPNVRAILLTGSVARGDADEISDIDTVIWYEEPPSFETIDAIRRQVGGSERLFLVGGPAEGGCAESYPVAGIKCDFAHVGLAALETDLAEVLEQQKPDSPVQKVIAGILEGVPLYGAALIEAWKAKVALYPDGLAEAMVRHHLRFHPRWVLEKMGADRDDTLFLYECLVEAEKKIMGILLGLNRIYHWGELKRLDALASAMTIAPPELARRLKAVLRAEPHAAVRELDALIEETLALVEARMPGVDVGEAWRRYRRAPGS